MRSLLLRCILLALALGEISGCDVADAFCEQEDDLESSGSLNLLQTQTQLNGQSVLAHPSAAPAGAAANVALLSNSRLQNLHQVDKNFITDDKSGLFFEGPPGNPSTCLATCLFGFLVVMLSFVYLVTMTYPITQASSWSIFNKVVVAFCGALIMACYRDVTNYSAPQYILSHYFLLLPFLRLAAVLVALKLVLHFFRDDDNLLATANLGSFVLGFTAIDAFNGLLRLDGSQDVGINFAQSPGAAGVGACCCVAMMLLGIYFFTLMRSKQTEAYGAAASHGRWLEQSEEVEDDAFAIVTGFLVCQVATFGLMDLKHNAQGVYPAMGVPSVADQARIPYSALVAVIIIFALWQVIACSIWSFKRLKVTNQVHRIEHLIVRTTSTTLVWCILRWGQLVFFSEQGLWFGQSDPMLARLVMALGFSISTAVFVLVVTCVMRESEEGGTPDFHALSSSLGLLIGQSWMECFYRASAGFGVPSAPMLAGDAKLLGQQLPSRALPYGGDEWQSFIQVGLIAALLLLVVPVWKAYILPRVARKEHSVKETSATPAIDAFLGVTGSYMDAQGRR